MSFLAPGWLVVAGVASAAVLALHLLNRQRLRSRDFPTARFIPDVSVRAVSRTWQPTDLVLLLLRVATLALIGLALARPVAAPPRRTVVILLADRSPAADSTAVAAALGRRSQAPDTVIAFDNLSVGLVAARRAAGELSRRGDQVALAVFSPLAVGLWDASTTSMRATWPGGIGVVRTRLRANVPRGAARVIWPTEESSDTANAVYAGGAAMVGRFAKAAHREPRTEHGMAIAWFEDGSPAVMEYPTPDGCDRVVGFKADQGDALIRAAGLRFAERLAAPCGAGWTPEEYELANSSLVNALAGSGELAMSRAFERYAHAPIVLFPLILALLVLGGERYLRRVIP